MLWFVLGANSSLTAAVVVVTGLVGANFVQATLDKLQFRDPIARGIATASRYESLLNPSSEPSASTGQTEKWAKI